MAQQLKGKTLDPIDRADLHRRGFSDADIERMGAVSWWNGLGYLIPTRDWEGHLTGGQIRRRQPAGEGRYAWGINGLHLANGEMPLQVLQGDPTKPIYLIEGTGAKPWKVHTETGATVVGAAGGNFAGCSQQVAEILQFTAEQEHVLLPDAGAVFNQKVMLKYQRLADLIPGLAVQWWNQLEKGIDPDADETAFWQDGIRLLSTDFFSADFLQRCHEQIQVRRSHQLTRQPTTTSEGAFLPAGSIPTDQPLVALHAPPGGGKTKVMVDHINSSGRRTIAACHRRNLSRNFSARTGTLPHRQDGELFCPKSGEELTTGVPAAGDSSCIDSWHRGSSVKRTPQDFDGSIFTNDEADQGIDHLLRGKTCRQFRSDIIDTFRQGLPRAAQTIIASGTLDDITVDLYEAVTGHTPHLHRHNSTAQRWSHSFLDNATHAIGQAVQAVKAGQRILIATGHAGDDGGGSDISAHNLLASLRQQCPDLNDSNSAAFTSASIADGAPDSRQKLFMRDPVAAVRDLRVAIYSPVAETGVDINLQGHFQSVFVLSDGVTMSPQTVMQSACRLRDPAAHRYFCVPNSSRSQKGYGTTDPRELIATILEDANYNEARFDLPRLASVLANAWRSGGNPADDPFLLAWAKLEIRAELDAKHYRFVLQSLLKDFGSEQKRASVVTELDKAIAQQVRQFVDQKKSEAAVAVITAPLPGTPDFDVAPREQKVAGRRRQKLEIVTGKTLSPKTTSEAEVLQTEKAIGPLKLRFLLQNPELAITIANEARRQVSDWQPDVARINTANRVESLIEMDARTLLQPGKIWSSQDPEIRKLNAYLGQHSARLRRWFGGQPKQYADPIRALQWLAKVVGMKTDSLERITVNGTKVAPQRVRESHDTVNVDAIFDHWRKNPAIVTGIQPQKGGQAKPAPRLTSGRNSVGDISTVIDLRPGEAVPTAGDIDLSTIDW